MDHSARTQNSDRKWFVMLDDRYQGPFTVGEIEDRIDEGRLQAGDPVWAEGMPEWRPMWEIGELDLVFRRARGDLPEWSYITPQEKPAPAPAPAQRLATPEERAESARIAARARRRERVRSAIRLATMACGAAALLAAAQLLRSHAPALESLGLRAPPPAAPEPYEISQDEYRELRSTVSEDLVVSGPSIAIALSTRDPFMPVVIVASNLPDGARIDIYVEGIPETLLGRTSAAARETVTVTRGYARTQGIRLEGNVMLPPGEYRVFAAESESSAQPQDVSEALARMPALARADVPRARVAPVKVFARKAYFVGGPRDAAYEERLRKFHEELREKAQSELVELNQYAVTLEDQLRETVTKFQEIIAKGGSKKAWARFHRDWAAMEQQLDTPIGHWTPETLDESFFYPSLYRMVREAGTLLKRAHEEQAQYFAPGADQHALETRIAENGALAQSTILALRSKLSLAEHLPTTANGMPTREGL